MNECFLRFPGTALHLQELQSVHTRRAFLLHGWPDSTASIHRSSSTSAALFRRASYMLCLWLRFIFCPLQLCHFEGALRSCFTLSLSLGTCLLYRAYRLFPLVEPIKRFFVRN